jgi:hypothetical protein
VGTLLDLLNLTLSVAPISGGERPRTTVVVVVIPMISHFNLNSIERSCIYKVSLYIRVAIPCSYTMVNEPLFVHVYMHCIIKDVVFLSF